MYTKPIDFFTRLALIEPFEVRVVKNELMKAQFASKREDGSAFSEIFF